jgi:predicted transposase YbfD/YdcC
MNYTIQSKTGISFEVKSLYAAFQKLRDGRKRRGRRYELAVILTLSVLAKLAGEDEPEGMAEWVRLRGESLRQELGLVRERMPHAVTYRRVLGQAVNIEEFEKVCGQFFAECGAADEQLAMDGKSMRGTIESGQHRGVYLLAVYGPHSGVVLNEVNIEQKANEISAAPEVLKDLDLHGKVVTGDALFTQRELSQTIVNAGGDYLWLVKDNQPTLRADIERLFGPEHVPLGSAPLKTDFQTVTATPKDPGRVYTHTLITSSLLNPTTTWPHLGQVFQLTRDVRYPKDSKTTHEVMYGITSLSKAHASPQRLLSLRRDHWAIENRLHYCRDVTFHEDACRLAIGLDAHAIAILNNLVLSLLRLRAFPSIASARRQFDACPALAIAFVLNAFA